MEDQLGDLFGVGDCVLGGQVATGRDARQREPRKVQVTKQLLKIVDKERCRVLTVRWLVAVARLTLFVVDNRTKLPKRRACQLLEVIYESPGSAMDHHEWCPRCRSPTVRTQYRARCY